MIFLGQKGQIDKISFILLLLHFAISHLKLWVMWPEIINFGRRGRAFCQISEAPKNITSDCWKVRRSLVFRRNFRSDFLSNFCELFGHKFLGLFHRTRTRGCRRSRVEGPDRKSLLGNRKWRNTLSGPEKTRYFQLKLVTFNNIHNAMQSTV